METIYDIIECLKTQPNITYEQFTWDNPNDYNEIYISFENIEHFKLLLMWDTVDTNPNNQPCIISLIPNTKKIYYDSFIYKEYSENDDLVLILKEWASTCEIYNLIYDKYKERFSNGEHFIDFIVYAKISKNISLSLFDFIMKGVVSIKQGILTFSALLESNKELYMDRFEEYLSRRILAHDRNQKLIELKD